MMTSPNSKERTLKPLPGAAVLIALILSIVIAFVFMFRSYARSEYLLVMILVGIPVLVLTIRGFCVVQPNMARVLTLMGKYKGTLRQPGFFWVHPFAARTTISLKAVNMASNTIKVNDLSGNPIEIGAVVVFRVHDTAQAQFDVEDYRHFADVQIETAIRQLASNHPYDDHNDYGDIPSLRGDSDQVAKTLEEQLQSRLDRAGIGVIEARISHLAYAPEIASAMLQRQQAAAIIAARQQIVEGAVGMVHQALESLAKEGVVNLDDERKATLVGNLLVVLCGQADAQPVINTGSLYN